MERLTGDLRDAAVPDVGDNVRPQHFCVPLPAVRFDGMLTQELRHELLDGDGRLLGRARLRQPQMCVPL